MWADPYVNLPSGTGFVLVDPSLKTSSSPSSSPPLDTHTSQTGITSEEGSIVGYILVAFDVPSFERELEESWFPQFRKKYPLSYEPPTDGSPIRKEGDIRVINGIHEPYHADAPSLALSPAHMHIDILPGYQGQGWGKNLIGTVVNFLKEEKGLDALWLGLDPRNENARRFYGYLGYKPIEGAPDHILGLRFEDWKAPA